MEGTGRLPEPMKFDGNLCENFKRFCQNFELYLTATEKDTKPDKVKVAILLNTIGSEGVEIYNTFRFPEDKKEKYDSVLEEFKNYCAPRKNRKYERFVFNSRSQGGEESFDHFYGDLKKLIQSCEYETQEDTILIDRIILGTNDLKVQEKLLSIQNVTLENAVEICRNTEVTKRQLQNVRNKEEVTIDYIKKKRERFNVRNKEGKDRVPLENKIQFQCRKCGRSHEYKKCPAYGKVCHKCGKVNHFSRECRNVKVKDVKNILRNKISASEHEDIDSLLNVGTLTNKMDTIWNEVIEVNGESIKFKIDTGSEVNIMSLHTFKLIKSNEDQLQGTGTLLQAYGGTKIKPRGKTHIKCRNDSKSVILEFFIVNLNVEPILGLPSSRELGYVKYSDSIKSIHDKEKFIQASIDVFEGLGTCSDICKITLKKDSIPVAVPCRRVPLSVKSRLKTKLESLEKQKIIAKVDGASEWVNPLVIVEKTDKSLRLCIDPQELNKCIQREFFEIPTFEEIRSKLSGKQYFSVLDLKDGFYQVPLDSDSSKLTTFSTPFGCYKFLRLPFGIKSAPEFFQKTNYKNFGDIENVVIYFDDILIAASNIEEHDIILEKVINRAREKGVKFNKEKVQFRQTEVKYMGHIFDKNGMRIDGEKIKSITELKAPTCKKELQKLLGLVNYVRKFIPKLGEIERPICDLLKKDVEFQWMGVHDEALDRIKTEINKNITLMNFDPKKQITIQTDASQNGIGCCLMQEGKPIAFSSRGLNETEKNYAVIEKEMLSIVYATQKFHNYIYGMSIKVVTDHKPNISVLNKRISQVHSPRLQRLRLKLLKYDIKIEYLPGKYLHIADYLSRNYSSEIGEIDKEMNEVVHSVEKYLRMSEKRKEEFKFHTKKDDILSKVSDYCMKGWQCKKYEGELNVYYQLRDSIHVYNGIIFFNDRVIVPKALRERMLKYIHEGHFGTNRSCDRANGILFWPGMSTDIKRMIQNCKICERYKCANVKEPLILHEIPVLPFQKIASDILEYKGKSYLVVVDYLTKWLEIIVLKSKRSCDIIEEFKKIFATHGVPDIVIADNMPYSSYECQSFAKEYDFEFKTSSPKYPKSNGLAERFVQTAKNILNKSNDLNVALMEYRNTPITGLKRSPAELLYNRKLKTKLPTVEEVDPRMKDFKDRLQNKNKLAKHYYDRHAKKRADFKKGDHIVYRKNKQWQPALIIDKHKSPRSYLIDTGNNILRRNSSHIRESFVKNRLKDSYGEVWVPEINNQTPNNNNDINGSVEKYVRPVRSKRIPSKFKDYILY